MLRPLVLILLISGVSTRGVPTADDNVKLGPKGIKTDRKDQSSEHVTITECEDCSHDDGDHVDDIILEGGADEDDFGDANLVTFKTKPKAKRTRRIKPFLTFHRIRVNVERSNHGNRNNKRHHHKSKTATTEIKEQKGQIDNANQERTSSVNIKQEKNPQSSTHFDSNVNYPTRNTQGRNAKKTNSNSYSNVNVDKSLALQSQTDSKSKSAGNEKGGHVAVETVDTFLSKNIPKKPKTQEEDKKEKTTLDKTEKKEAVNIHPRNKGKHRQNVKSDEHVTLTDKHETIRLTSETVALSNKEKASKSEAGNADIGKAENEFAKGTTDTKKKTMKSKSAKSTLSTSNPDSKEKLREFFSSKERTNENKIKTETLKTKPKDKGVDRKDEKSEQSLTISTEKPKDEMNPVDRVIPNNSRNRWSRKGLSQVPDVERLERRLHPTVDAPVSDIIKSMKNMLKLIRSSLYKVDADFQMIQNTTRWKYMVGVRDQLSELAIENDEIYDVVMDASLLTKQIYRQAHERKHPRTDIEAVAVAYRSKLNTNMHPQIRKNFYAAQKELEEAKQLIADIKRMKIKKEFLVDEGRRVHLLVSDKLPMRSMHDLYRRADQTIRVLQSSQSLSKSGDKSRLYGHMRNDTAMNMRRARELTVEGYDLLEHSKRVLLQNRQKVQEHGRIMRSRVPAGTMSDMPFNDRSMDLFVAWDQATYHANSLSESAAEIHMKFVPLIKKAKEVTSSTKEAGFQKRLEQSLSNMKDIVKRLVKTLDKIRIVVGDEGILQDRCEDIEGSGGFSDDEDSPINCDPYITIKEGSGDDIEGSGDADNTLIDLEMTKSNIPLHATDEKASVDVDITQPEPTSGLIDITQPEPTSGLIDVTLPEPTSENVDITKIVDKPPTDEIFIDDTDDEDIAQELKRRKSTQKTSLPPSTTAPPTTSIPESTKTNKTSDSSDDDMFFDPFGWWNDQPDDDSIILGTDDDATDTVIAPMKMTLNEHIRERLYNYSQDSKALQEKAQTSKSNIQEISLTWQKVQKRFATLENQTINAKSVVTTWKAERAYFKAVHDSVKSVEDDVMLKKEVVEAQCSEALDVANKKVKDFETVKEKQSEKAKNAADPTVVNEAVTQVKVVLDNVKEINRLKQLYPSPCGTLENLDRKIRSNITELRKKIDRAKLIASSLQIAVSMPKTEYLEFPISDQSDADHPLTTQVQMMLKHTGSDGRLVSMHVGESESLSLEVQTDALTVVQSIDGDESSHPLYADGIEDKWYLIQLQRFATSYNFTMIGEKGILGTVGLPSSLDEQRISTQELLPTSLHVGGTGEDLSACALGLEINGRSINMFDMSDNDSFPTPCSSQGRWTSNQPRLLLDGSGYAVMSFNVIRGVRTIESLKLTFTPHSDGTVVFLQPERMATVIDVYVDKGFLVVYVHYRGFETKLKSTVDIYNKKQILEISFISGRSTNVNVVLNGKSNVFKSAKGGKRGKHSESKNIFIGGLREENSSMVGCIKSLEINGEEIPFHNINEAEGHSYGSCLKTECVKFDSNSVPIEMTNLSTVQMIHISIKRGSLGPVLQYSKHKDKFNLEISLNTEGIHVEETVKDKSEDFSLNGDSEFIVIAIQDDSESKSVTVTVDDESEDFSYGKGGGFLWGNNDDEDDGPVSYSVSVATSSEDSPPFVGTIQNLILDGRPMELLKYEESSKLRRCTVDPAPRTIKETKPAYKGLSCQ